NGAPVGGQYLDQTTVTIGSLGNTTPPTTLTSAGGLYISGDHVELNTHGGYMTTFDVAGQTLIHAIVQADLTNPGDLRTDITGGAVNIEENQGNLAVGNVTANSINIDANYGVTAGNLAAPTIGIDAGGDVRVGAVVAYGDGFGLYIHSLGNVTAGDIEARQATINAGQAAGDTISTGNVTAQSAVVFTAGGDIRTGAIDPATVTLDSTYGSVTAGDVTASDSITIDAGDKVTTGNLAAPTTTISAASDVQVGAVDATGDGSGLYVKTSGSVKTGDIDASSATIYAGDGAADTILVGNVTAAYTVVFTGGGDIRTGAINPASVTLESFYGAVDTGDITATYSIVIGAAGAVTTGNLEAPSATITAAGDVQIGTVDATGGGSGLYIHSYGSVKTGDIDASSATIHAGRYAGDTILVGNVTAEYAVILTAGGDIHTSAIDPTFVNIVSYYGSVATGDIASSGSVFVNAYSNITTGAVTAGYNINMNARVGTLETGALSAGSYVSLYSGGDMTIGGITSGGAFLRAGSFYSYSSAPADITITGAVSVNEATFIATGTFRNEAPITVTATETSNYGPSLYNASNGEVVIHAGDVDLQAPITAIDAGGTGRIIIEADNPDGVNIGDNLSSPSGFEMSNSEFGELKADQVYVLDFNRTADMRIGDLTIDAAKTPQVAFGAGHYSEAKYLTSQGQTISVEGTVSGVGNPTLIIGPNLPGHYGFKYYDYAPAHVIVSGAIGTASNPFGHVEISATYSIVIGSQTFAQEVGNGTAPSGWVEGLGGVEDGHEFISAGDVTLYSPGVIVGQDTSPRGDGMHITGSLTIEGDPTEVNLFGQLPGANGVILYGPIASTSPDLIVISYGGAAVGPYRFNGCLFGGADCQATIEVPITGFVPPLYAPTAGVYAGASPITITANGTGFGPGIDGVGSSFGPIVVAPSALPLGGDRDDGDRNDGEDGRRHRNGKNKGGKATVSGMGNEDHWPEGKH
ncbi:MAG TPA: hypothetical protein VG407_08170, partial [Caulobacteraceae bacterium]|nr:hypothetical protein [Caulobacteraceae bacterium]